MTSIIDEIVTEAKTSYSYLMVERANSTMLRASTQPIPKMLFSKCMHQGEVCFLFADTGLGKTILAIQIGVSIASGVPVAGFEMEAPAQPVLYLDFELSDKQFQNRYSANYQDNYKFPRSFYRIQVDRDKIDVDGNIEDLVLKDIEAAIKNTGARVVIVDNITWLKTETEHAKDALPLMKHLKRLQREYDLSILVLAHTPKIAESTPISVNDMAGSKHLMNFVDSAFALGRSHKDGQLRYLKQIKVRACEAVFTTHNVVSLRIEKHCNFTEFRVVDYGKEYDHLKPLKEVENEIKAGNIVTLKRLHPEMSNREIARRTGTNHTNVKRVLDTLDTQKIREDDGQPF
jgi:RecA-family ATPase